jgi:hypothetical protein
VFLEEEQLLNNKQSQLKKRKSKDLLQLQKLRSLKTKNHSPLHNKNKNIKKNLNKSLNKNNRVVLRRQLKNKNQK